MKKLILTLLCVVSTSILVKSQVKFASWFKNQSLRVDFYLGGHADTTLLFWDKLHAESAWAGNHYGLIDETGYGDYICRLYDKPSNQLIFSTGFSSLFREWQFTAEAKTVSRCFEQSVLIPYPLDTCILRLFSRESNGMLRMIGHQTITPRDYRIEEPDTSLVEIIPFMHNGDPGHTVDLVFIPDGYSAEEKAAFTEDAKRLIGHFFSVDPFQQHRHKFNISGLFVSSPESGSDIPGADVWKNTALNSHYYTFDSERYLITFDNFILRDITAVQPYDQIVILVNSDKYGGGGIYNHYTILSAGDAYAGFLLLHEFGHAFAGLGDEYYTSEVAYEQFYQTGTEPWQPNLTTLDNFHEKWAGMVEKDVPVPTPFLEEYQDKVGVYEGAGYVAKGVYRPFQDCIMKSRDAPRFCPVCQKAIREKIMELTK